MSNFYEALWWHMHKKPADEFDSGNGIFFPFAVFSIILYIVSNSIFVHANDTMIADGNSMCILAEVVNDRLCTIEGFLAMRNPFFFWERLAHGTASVTTGIIVNLWMSTVFTELYVSTISSGFAIDNTMSHLCLLRRRRILL